MKTKLTQNYLHQIREVTHFKDEYTKLRKQLAVAAYLDGVPISKIAAAARCSTEVLHNWVREEQLTHK